MLYSELAETFDRLDKTSSRLEMASILSEFFRTVDTGSLKNCVYLSQGKLHPDFFAEEFGMADKLVLRAIGFVSGTPDKDVEKLWVKEGDPGVAAEVLIGI
ncbi:MAG: DNA ligase, partial [Candidatus Methanoplasma sp.]|nr:DNA ligase [Candidatus Methanoplasma sp.]